MSDGVNARPWPLFRDARDRDIPAIVGLLADDPLGASREDTSPSALYHYCAAFEEIKAQIGNRVIVATNETGEVIGCLQLTIIPGLSRKGMTRGLLEGVRVRKDMRGQKVGAALLRHAIKKAESAGCDLVQLTTDKLRIDALNFYASLGFEHSHAGMKMHINRPPKSLSETKE